jgi:hypothetical protein
VCRSIQQLRGADPSATDEEVRDAALQYVRKISGYRVPSAANREAFGVAVDDVAAATRRLLDGLVVTAGSRPADPVQRRLRSGQRSSTGQRGPSAGAERP